MMRWWWFGPSVDDGEIDRELTAMAQAGLGGVELAFVYPLGEAATAFGSEEFSRHVRHAATRAHELGLRFDLTLGSGWSFGGPHIAPAHAARQLHWDVREIGAAPTRIRTSSAWPGDDFVAAYLADGAGLADADEFTELAVVDGDLVVPPGNAPRTVTVLTSRLTGQSVKRAAAGAEGPVLDHYSAAATRAHIEAVAEPLLAAVGNEPVGSVFCDSLEVYGADWTPGVLAEFAARRGYDARPLLYLLAVDRPGADRVRADYYRTLSELYEENFVTPLASWAGAHRVPFRIQSYGTPPATLASYRAADICEGEGWRWTAIPETRWASSAAHALGRDVVSAETWTWVHSPTFRATPLDLQGEAHQHFLNGVNHLIGHGWPYSPADAPGLGWFFYAAGALDDRNPWWPAMPGLARYLQRLCWLLRQGTPVRDISVYVPTDDVYHEFGPSTGGSLNLWRHAASRIGAAVPATIRRHGWDFDLVDDETLGAPDGRLVVLASATVVPPRTREWLAQVIRTGGAVVAVDCPDFDLPGATACTSAELAEVLAAHTEPDVTLAPPAEEVGVVHRRLPEADVYVVANTANTTQAFTFTPRTPVTSFERWDPGTGTRVGLRTAAPVPLELAPYEATVLVGSPAQPDPRVERRSQVRTQMLSGWQVTFPGDPGPVAVDLPHRWEDDPARAAYSGTAAYEIDIEVSATDLDGRVVLDLGPCEPAEDTETYLPPNSFHTTVHTPVPASAQVFLDGRLAGTVWAPPYAIDLTAELTPGTHRLQVVVANTAANRLTVETRIGDLEQASARRYGRRFRMQHLRHAGDTLSSGLRSRPWLRFEHDS